jgi:hypothetical protein
MHLMKYIAILQPNYISNLFFPFSIRLSLFPPYFLSFSHVSMRAHSHTYTHTDNGC